MESRAGAWQSKCATVPAPITGFSLSHPGLELTEAHRPETHPLTCTQLDGLAVCTHPGVGCRGVAKSLFSVAGARGRAPEKSSSSQHVLKS